PAGDVHREPRVAGNDREVARRLRAGQRPAPRLEALLVTRPALRALVDAPRRAQLGESLDERRAPRLGAGGEKLTDEIPGIAIDDQTRQPVGLGEHEPTGRPLVEQPEAPSRLDGALQPTAKKGSID